MLLSLAVLIVAIVGLWNHDWLLIGIVIAVKIIGCMIYSCKCEEKKPRRKVRARKRRR